MSQGRSLYRSKMGREYIFKFRDNPVEGSVITVDSKSYIVKKSRWVRHRLSCKGLVVKATVIGTSFPTEKMETRSVCVVAAQSCPGCECCGYIRDVFQRLFPESLVGFRNISHGKKYAVTLEHCRPVLGCPPAYQLRLEEICEKTK